MIVALAGGVGGARLAHGLYRALPPDTLTVVVNTGDDFERYGLRICPDADTVLYTLAELANSATGWGIAGDTTAALDMLKRYGDDAWFWLGDRDLATHLLRTEHLRAGQPLTKVMQSLAAALGVRAALLPMSDEPVATLVNTPDGELAFQEYFVRRQHQDTVLGARFDGIEQAHIPNAARAAIQEAEAIIFCPSNPIVSIGPILAVPGMRDLLRQAAAPKVAASPLIGGKALKGPADRMLTDLGYESSAVGVATLYRDLLQGMVIDEADAHDAPRIEALSMRVLVTQTVMRDTTDRERLARETLAFAATLRTADRGEQA
ncbi:MAG: 2-phospho-L-lactate transferase [Ktedonobacterales bacterium]